MNDLERVAQRLEEMSVELDNDELLGLAETLHQWEPPVPTVVFPGGHGGSGGGSALTTSASGSAYVVVV